MPESSGKHVPRGPFAGVIAVFQFNYTFYIGGVIVGLLALALAPLFTGAVSYLITLGGFVSLYFVVGSVLATHWIYDRSDLYRFSWLGDILQNEKQRAAVLHAGYDEVTGPLAARFPGVTFESYDFLRPGKRTEPSIVRARKLYGDPNAEHLEPGWKLRHTYDSILLLLSAHELRTADERVRLLAGIRPSLAPGGTIALVEHMRNGPNFLAFGPGAFHFWSRSSWEEDFSRAGLMIKKQFAITPFLRGYFLK